MLVVLLGGLGAATRFVVDGVVTQRSGTGLPVGTMLVNVSGSALLGLLTGARLFHGLDETAYVVLAVGFCGGYTTFSTAMVETVRLAQGGDVRRAVVTVTGSLVLAVAAAAAGVAAMAALDAL
nr:CrcB family protein [Ornithinimicrobium sediminis]